MSKDGSAHRLGSACIASKLAVVLIAVSVLVMPAPAGCLSALNAEGPNAPVACHLQTIAALNASWALPTSTTPAVMPNASHALPILAAVALLATGLLMLELPAAIMRRMRFMRGIWATSLPFKGAIPRLPYFAPQRDA